MKPLKADLLMLAVTICWGSSYLFMKMGLHSVGEFMLIALRFGLAFLVTAPFFARRLRSTDLRTLKYAALLGLILFGIFVSILFGLNTTTTSNAGFLVSLTVVFVPILSVALLKHKLAPRMLIGVTLAIAGIGMITLHSPFSIRPGDGLCALGALFYAMHILVSGAVTKKADSLNLGILQLGFTGAYGLICSFIFETPRFPFSAQGWIAVLVLSIACSAFGYVAQMIAQKHTTPTRVSLIFSLEPVFAAFIGICFGGESMTLRGYIGGALVLLGVAASEIKPRQRSQGRLAESAKQQQQQPLSA